MIGLSAVLVAAAGLLLADFLDAGAFAATLLAGAAFAAAFGFAAGTAFAAGADFTDAAGALAVWLGVFSGVFAGFAAGLPSDAGFDTAAALLAGAAFAATFGFAEGAAFADVADFTDAAGVLAVWLGVLSGAFAGFAAGLPSAATFLADTDRLLAAAFLILPEDFFVADVAVFSVAILDAAILDCVTGFACLATLTSQLASAWYLFPYTMLLNNLSYGESHTVASNYINVNVKISFTIILM